MEGRITILFFFIKTLSFELMQVLMVILASGVTFCLSGSGFLIFYCIASRKLCLLKNLNVYS